MTAHAKVLWPSCLLFAITVLILAFVTGDSDWLWAALIPGVLIAWDAVTQRRNSAR